MAEQRLSGTSTGFKAARFLFAYWRATVLLSLCCFLAACAAGPRTKQEKADWMFLFPGDNPFSFETLYGSSAAFRALKTPERIEVYRISPFVDLEPEKGMKTILGHQILSGPVVPSDQVRGEFAALFSSKDTFGDRPACGREPGVLVRVISGRVTVDLLFCFKCRDVVVVRNDKRLEAFHSDREDIQVSMTENSAKSFLRLFRSLFPDDRELKGIKLK